MSFATKHNKGGINWGIDTEKFEYYSLKDLYEIDPDATYILRGVFINTKNNSEYGNSVVAILDDKLVNLPGHMEAEISEILKDDDDITDIKAGKVGFSIHEYESHKKTCYSADWEDL